MNYPEFMTAIIEVYGDYTSPALKKITAMYIKEKWQESELENIFKKLILVKTAKYKTPPDPAELEELFFRKSDAEYEIEANAAWNDLQRYSSHYDAICSDIRVQLAIETAFGSWEQFGQRLTKYEALHHKNFTEAFVRFSKFRQDIQPSLMRGGGNYFTPPPPQLIGDKDKCRMLLEQQKDGNLKLVESMVGGMRA